MIKVLNKSFDMLELLGTQPQRAFNVTETAAALKLSKSTAGRILKDLAARGYADQRSCRSGYSLGPMAYKLASKGIFRKDLIDASSDTIKHFAHEVMRECIILAVMLAGRRYIIVKENGNPHLQPVHNKPWYDDFYDSATGRQLLANASESEISDYLKTHPLPTPYFPEAKTTGDLRAELARIKAEPYLSFRSSNTSFWVLAFPIRFQGRLEASLGITVPFESFKAPHSDALIESSSCCAKLIEEKLSEIYGFHEPQ